MRAEWPLVGRAGEVARLRELMTAGSRASVVLAGAAGVGKTRLAVECLKVAEELGAATCRITATRAGSELPFGALAPLLPAAHHGDPGAVDNRADLLRRSAEALVARAGGRRLVLLVDDAHWLDDASAMLIHQLAATQAGFVLVTVRAGEPAPDPIVALWKDEIADRIDLLGLSAEAVEEALTLALEAPVARAAAAQLAVRCQGNMLLLRELVVGALADGSLRKQGGLWQLVGSISPSGRLIELVESRLAGLAPSGRQLLELVSFGEPLGPGELAALGSPEIAADLERRGLLVTHRSGQRLEVRLAHPLYGEALRARVPALGLPAIARSLAEVVEATGARRREDILRVATWRLDGGGAGPEVMFSAATIARWRYDFGLAERLARAAEEAGAGFDAVLLRAELACLQGRVAESEAVLAALSRSAVDDAQRGAVAVARLDNQLFFLGDVEAGLRIADEAEATIGDPAWRDEITAKRAGAILGKEGPAAAAKLVAPLIERAEGRALTWACLVASCSFSRIGRVAAGLDAADRGYAAHLALTHPQAWYPWFNLFLRCEVLTDAGRFAEAEALASAQCQQGLADNSPEAVAVFSWHLTKLFVNRGRVASAARHGQEAVALLQQLGRPQFVRECLVHHALALTLGRRVDDARAALSAFDVIESPTLFTGAVDLIQARAWVSITSGRMSDGTDFLTEAIQQAEAIGDLVGLASSLHAMARIGRAAEVTEQLSELAPRLEGDLPALRAAHVRALAAEDADALAAAAAEFAAIGADLLAAEAAADSAAAWRRAGNSRRCSEAMKRASALAARCEGALTPALLGVGVRTVLTSAERAVAVMAAKGHTNRQIADELYISVRTVGNHLQHAYTKLGISSRAELSGALEDSTDVD